MAYVPLIIKLKYLYSNYLQERSYSSASYITEINLNKVSGIQGCILVIQPLGLGLRAQKFSSAFFVLHLCNVNNKAASFLKAGKL
ncbi:MAG: hypothetical protein ACO1OF_04615 [Adhaeribacter sp.]